MLVGLMLASMGAVGMGCSSAASPQRKLLDTESAPYRGRGSASIEGAVVLRLPSGERPAGVDTHVYMTPATSLALARYSEFALQKNALPDRPKSELWWIGRTDANGRFSFGGLPAGEYILVSEIVWASPVRPAPYRTVAHARVRVGAGQKVNVVLAGDAARAK